MPREGLAVSETTVSFANLAIFGIHKFGPSTRPGAWAPIRAGHRCGNGMNFQRQGALNCVQDRAKPPGSGPDQRGEVGGLLRDFVLCNAV